MTLEEGLLVKDSTRDVFAKSGCGEKKTWSNIHDIHQIHHKSV